MSDEEEVLLPKDSKCSTCKYGMCVLDKDTQSFFGPATVDGDAFGGQPDQPGISETSFPVSKVRSLCFWRPEGTQTMAPVVFSAVADCSRYEKRNR